MKTTRRLNGTLASQIISVLMTWAVNDVRKGRTAFISLNKLVVEYMYSESQSRWLSLWSNKQARTSVGEKQLFPVRKCVTVDA
jgi:hypothetical protein